MRQADNSYLDGWMNEGSKTQNNFKTKVPEDLEGVNDINVLKAEISKLRTESRNLKTRVKDEQKSK